jgi:hypothetical protein
LISSDYCSVITGTLLSVPPLLCDVSFLANLVDELRSGCLREAVIEQLRRASLLFVKDGGSVEPGTVMGTINQV